MFSSFKALQPFVEKEVDGMEGGRVPTGSCTDSEIMKLDFIIELIKKNQKRRPNFFESLILKKKKKKEARYVKITECLLR